MEIEEKKWYNEALMDFKRTVLSNGLRVLTIPMPSFESATVMLMVAAGSRYETKQNNGISHFLEHMAFKGTKKRPTAMDIASLIDGMGGEFNAFTGKETTGYYIKSSVANVDLSMDILSDIMQHSLFDAAEIEKEKGVIMEEINLYEDTPARKIGDIYEQLLYGDTPLGWDIAGEKQIIRSVVRDDFTNYMASLYSASNMTLVVAGGVDTKNVREMAEKYFTKMRQFETLRYSGVVENQEKSAVLIKQKKTEQAHFALGVRTVAEEHPDKYPLWLLSAVLGGGMSSRLFSEIREKRGLAYYVRTHSDHYTDCGSLVSMAGVDAKRADEAVKVAVAEYRKIANGKSKIANDELKKAKEFTKGHLVLDLEDSRSVAGFYAQQELLEKTIDNPDDILVKIDKVTVEDIQRVAQKYLGKNPLNLAVIGNFEEKERFQKLLEA